MHTHVIDPFLFCGDGMMKHCLGVHAVILALTLSMVAGGFELIGAQGISVSASGNGFGGRASQAHAEFLTLSQYCELGFSCYFVDASAGELVILRPEKKYDEHEFTTKILPARSNVVIAAYPGNRYVWENGEREVEQLTPPRIQVSKTGLKSWSDRKGHVHTIAVLQQQLDFNFALLARWRADCAIVKCSIQIEGGEEILLRPVKATGILDRETLAAPLRLLQLSLHDLRMELLARCRQETRTPCSAAGGMPRLSLERWRSLIAEGFSTTAEYEAELADFPFEVPKPPTVILTNRVFPEDAYAGISGLDLHFVPKTMTKYDRVTGSTDEYFSRNDRFALAIDDSAPENAIIYSAALGGMASSRIEALRTLHRIAVEKILAARRYADELYPEVAE